MDMEPDPTRKPAGRERRHLHMPAPATKATSHCKCRGDEAFGKLNDFLDQQKYEDFEGERATCKTKKFFTLGIQEKYFSFAGNEEAIAQAKRLNGMYAIRSNLKQEAAELVANYKCLLSVENAFSYDGNHLVTGTPDLPP